MCSITPLPLASVSAHCCLQICLEAYFVECAAQKRAADTSFRRVPIRFCRIWGLPKPKKTWVTHIIPIPQCRFESLAKLVWLVFLYDVMTDEAWLILVFDSSNDPKRFTPNARRISAGGTRSSGLRQRSAFRVWCSWSDLVPTGSPRFCESPMLQVKTCPMPFRPFTPLSFKGFLVDGTNISSITTSTGPRVRRNVVLQYN